MHNEFLMPVCNVRKEDRIFVNDQWRTVTESRQYLGGPGEDGTFNDTPKWVINVAKANEDWDYETYPRYGKQPSDDYESPEDFWPYDCTDELTFKNADYTILVYSDKVEQLDENLRPYRWWVAVFEVDRAWGGPEEGGWWFDSGVVQQVVPVHSLEEGWEVIERLSKLWPDTGRASSVCYSGGEYQLSICKSYPKDYPQRVPHYC